MWENAYLSIKNPKASRALKRALDPCRKIARFARATALRYVTKFRPQNLGPPPSPNPGSAPEKDGEMTNKISSPTVLETNLIHVHFCHEKHRSGQKCSLLTTMIL